jgi:succinate dehydrogenase/fumarate reductase flavoprotein subunit
MSAGLTNSRPPEKAGVAAAPYKEPVLIIGGGLAGVAAALGLKIEIVKAGSRSLSSRFPHRRSAAHKSVN